MFDNIFSIFGKRGSGKTSAIFSLREQLMNKTGNDQDLVLPIIIPEHVRTILLKFIFRLFKNFFSSFLKFVLVFLKFPKS